jgi:hypothetical protein
MTNFQVFSMLLSRVELDELRVGAGLSTRVERAIEGETKILCRLAIVGMGMMVDHEGHEGGNDHFPRVDWTSQIEKFLGTL